MVDATVCGNSLLDTRLQAGDIPRSIRIATYARLKGINVQAGTKDPTLKCLAKTLRLRRFLALLHVSAFALELMCDSHTSLDNL